MSRRTSRLTRVARDSGSAGRFPWAMVSVSDEDGRGLGLLGEIEMNMGTLDLTFEGLCIANRKDCHKLCGFS